MECPHCHYSNSSVVETVQKHEINQTYRRRECLKCGVRFTTQEHYRDNYNPTFKTIPPKRVLEK